MTLERQQFEQWWETAMHNGYPPRFGWEHWRDGGGYRDDDGEFQGLWKAWVAGREALAKREAQPVARVDRRPAASGGICWQHVGKDLPHGTELFTAPPAPAVVNGRTAEGWMAEALLQKKIADDIRKSAPAVPEEAYSDDCPDLYPSQPDAWASGWNACRSAMLAQPVSSGYTLPDGFKLMPLEMTDEIGEAIAMEARCCGGIALDIYEAALAAAPGSGN